jgi:hypothetical protein
VPGARNERVTRIAGALAGSDDWLLQVTQARIGRPVHAATVLAVGAGALRGLIAGRPEHLVLAVTDEHVYLLEYRRRTFAPRVGGVVTHLPRSGLVAQWQRRPLDVKAELSWPDEHVFLTGRARPGAQTDRAIGLLMGSELERYT